MVVPQTDIRIIEDSVSFIFLVAFLLDHTFHGHVIGVELPIHDVFTSPVVVDGALEASLTHSYRFPVPGFVCPDVLLH